MKFGQFFVDRPIFAAVLSLFIVIVGGIAYFNLPVAQYPEVIPPTITVSASYPGATPEVIAETVALPIEQEINGIEGMLYMRSQSTNDGRMTLTITFALGTDLDEAQVLVENRVAVAEPRLPEEVRRLGVVTRKNSTDFLLVVHMRSPDASRDQIYITNYMLQNIRDRLARVDGVGDITVNGAREYAMRVWLDPDKVAAVGMNADEVVAALRGQNIQVSGGSLGQPPLDRASAFQTSLTMQGRLSTPEEFGQVIVKAGTDGRFTRLKDVARIELGAANYNINSYLDGQTAVAVLVFQRPGANALATAAAVQAEMKRLAADFPAGLDYGIAYNPTAYIQKSIDEVVKAIFEATFLVVIVVTLFLQSWRTAVIPILAIPVSLIGTFAVMAALGFSINNLTLFGMVLAIGIVVDDAIVVVENVERNLRGGMNSREAAKFTMAEVGGALISIALVLSAVFIPTAFLGGISGQFYRQFALTIAVATVISAFNSFTLSPALAALLLKPHQDHGGRENFQTRFNRRFDRLSDRYARMIRRVGGQPKRWLFGYVLLLGLTAFAFVKVPTGFIPEQEQGYIIVSFQLPPGASLSRTDAAMRAASEIIKTDKDTTFRVSFAGFSGATFTTAPNAGATFVGLSDPETRPNRSGFQIAQDLQRKLMAIEDGFIVVLTPPPVRGIGTAGGFAMMIEDRAGLGSQALADAARGLMFAANSDPRLTRSFTLFNADAPHLFVDIDRTRAEMLNLPVSKVFSTLEVYLGSSYVNDFNLFNRTYRVTAQADAPFRLDESDIAALRARSDNGAMVPLGSVATFQTVTGPDRVPRYNLYPAAEFSGSAAPGHSSGEAMAAITQLAKQVLPQGMSFEWTELSYLQASAGNTALFIFPLAVLFVFLVLAANYESWSLPAIVLAIVPMCLLSAMAGIILRGMDNNILTQIGFVVLVGLAAKNAILIVEFAKQQEEAGKSVLDAAVEAARLRLRPILMTSFAFILGVLPLVLASGAGAEMRRVLGTTVFSGMIGVTGFGLLFTPIFYVVVRGFATRKA